MCNKIFSKVYLLVAICLLIGGCSRGDFAPYEHGNKSVFIDQKSEIVPEPQVSKEPNPQAVLITTPQVIEERSEPVTEEENDDNADDKALEQELDELKNTKAKSAAEKPVDAKRIVQPAQNKVSKPHSGKVVSKFGSVDKSGYKNEGINIAGKIGDPVRAYKRGKVLYVGDKLSDYGNIVVIKHEDGLVSTYAHLLKYSVKKGDQIESGWIIGQLGKSGTVNSPQLHFQLTKNSQPIDPGHIFK